MPHQKESAIAQLGTLDTLKKEFRRLDHPEAERQEKAVHRIRVISRRLQVQAQLVAEATGRKGRSRGFRKNLKAIRRLLGKVREADVHRILWRGIAADTHCFLAIDRAIANRREKAFCRFRVRWDRKRLNNIIAKGRRVLEGVGETMTAPLSSQSISSRMMGLVRMPTIPADDDLESIHCVRLKVKKLRYLIEALETMNALHHFRSARPLSLLKELQGELGAIHDRETIIEFLERALRKSRDVWDPRTQASVEKACEDLKLELQTAADQWRLRWPERRKMLAAIRPNNRKKVKR